MSVKKRILLTGILTLMLCPLLPATVNAQELVQRHGPRIMQGNRPNAMGGAFLAVKGSDENAMFYNPAAINDYEKKVHFRFVLPTIDFSYKAIPFFSSDIPNLADNIDAAATNGAKVTAFDNFAATNTGRYEEIAVRGNVAIMMHKYITVALFHDTQAIAALINPASSTVDIEGVTTAGLAVGSAYSFFDDHLQAGVTVKFMGRHLINETVTQRDVITTNDFGDTIDFDNIGFGIGFDIGLKGTPPLKGKAWDYLKPMFALTLQDVGHTRFFAGDYVGKQKQSLSFGYALHPDFWKLKSTFAMDVRELEHRADFLTKFHVGYELVYPDVSKAIKSISVRVGINQAYLTAGFGMDFKYFKFNLATYGRELASRTIQKQSRMFSAQLSAGF